MGVLVKELRALNINGAPLLFQAASSRSKTTCFRTVFDALRTILTKSGQIQQLVAVDHMGRNVMMHSARGNHPEVFRQVRDLYHRSISSTDWDKRSSTDRTGRTLLHHAAEAGCLEVLMEVLNTVEPSQHAAMQEPDVNGRTPIMHALRLRYGHCGGRNQLKGKLKTLFENGGRDGWMQPREVLNRNEIRNDGVAVFAATELMHAARGGMPSLRLVLDNVQKQGQDEVIGTALQVSFYARSATGEPCGAKYPEETKVLGLTRQDWGWGMLLASAAKGGRTDVLDAIVKAIKVRINM